MQSPSPASLHRLQTQAIWIATFVAQMAWLVGAQRVPDHGNALPLLASASIWYHIAHHNPAGPVKQLQVLISSTQKTGECNRSQKYCACSTSQAGMFQRVHSIAACILKASLLRCKLVPFQNETSLFDAWVTSPTLRRTGDGLTYFQPLSNCWGLQVNSKQVETLSSGHYFSAGGLMPLLAQISEATGVRSTLTIMGAAVAWLFRPTQVLEDAYSYYSRAVRLGEERFMGVHARQGDKKVYNSNGTQIMMRDLKYTSADAYRQWATAQARTYGITRALLMSDSPSLVRTLRNDSLFREVPTLLECAPTFQDGSEHLMAYGQMVKRLNGSSVRDHLMPNGSDCGPSMYADDGIMLLVGVMMIAQGKVLIGTTQSNVFRATMEINAVLNLPGMPSPAIDVLNRPYEPYGFVQHEQWFSSVLNLEHTIS